MHLARYTAELAERRTMGNRSYGFADLFVTLMYNLAN